MAGWSGGTFTRAHDWTDDEAAGENIESVRMDAEDDNFATGINTCLTKDGQNAATGDLPMGGNKHTGVGAGATVTQYLRINEQLSGENLYAVSNGSANAQTLTLPISPSAYAAGMTFTFIAGYSNTGAMTMNVNSLGAKNVYAGDAALTGYEVYAGDIFAVVYDGTQFQLINPANKMGSIAYRDTSQTISSGVTTPIEFDEEDVDFAGSPIHSTSVNPARFTVLRTGIYICTVWVQLDGTATDDRRLFISVNGTATYADNTGSVASNTYMSLTGLVLATAGQYIEFEVVNLTSGEDILAARGGVYLLPAS